MRGRQFSYYVTPEDWSSLLDHLARHVDYDAHREIFRGALTNALLTLDEAKTVQDLSFCFSTPRSQKIFYGPFGTAVGKIGEYVIDSQNSEVIEVSRSYLGLENGDKVIRQARMWYIAQRLMPDGSSREKSEAFLTTAAAIFRHAKRSLTREGSASFSYYYGREALVLKRTGSIKFVV
jgi:hypothetical protein